MSPNRQPLFRGALLPLLSVVLAGTTPGADVPWAGDVNGNWGTDLSGDTNWVGDVLPGSGDSLLFGGNTNTATTNDLTAGTTFGGIDFTNDGSAGNDATFTLGGNNIVLGGDITSTAMSAGTLTDEISLDLQFNALRTIDLGTDHNLTISGLISSDNGNRRLIKLGDGVLTLTRDNTYGGGTELRDGTTMITNNGALDGVIEMEIGDPILELGTDGLNIAEEFFIRNEGSVKTIRLDLAGSNTGTLSGEIRNNEDTNGFFVIDVGADDRMTVSGRVTLTAGGGSGITKVGSGTLVLSNGTNDYTGLTTVSGGTLEVGVDGVLGVATPGDGTVVTGGGTLALLGDVNYTAAEELSLSGSGSGGVGSLQNLSGDNTYAGSVSLSGNSTIGLTAGSLTLSAGIDKAGRSLTVNGSGDLTLGAGLDGGGTLTKSGTGTLTLGAAGSHSGGTQLSDGTVVLLDGGAFGTSAEINMNAGTAQTTVELGADNLTVANNFFIRNNANTDRTIRLDLAGTNTGTFSGQFINNEATPGEFIVDVGEDDTLTMSGNLIFTGGTGASGLTKTGTGTLRLSNSANNYAGVTAVTEGTLEISADNALGATSFGTTVSSGATLALTGGINYTAAESLTLAGNGFDGLGALHNVSGNNTCTGPVTLSSSARIRSSAGALSLTGGISRAGGSALTIEGPGDVTISTNPLSGNGVLFMDGTGTLRLPDANDYTGVTQLRAGTTILSNSSSFGTSSLVDLRNDVALELDASGLNVANDFFIRNDAGLKTIRLDETGSNAGEFSGGFTINEVSAGDFVVDLGAEDSLTLSGNLISSGAGGGAGITKTGAGTLILSGNNTYLGATDVDAGTLLVDNTAGSGTHTGAVTVASGATLGGTGSIGGNTTIASGGSLTGGTDGGVGTLTFSDDLTTQSGSTWLIDITLGSGSGSLNLGSSDLITQATGTMNISGATLDLQTTGTYTLGEVFRIADYTAGGASLTGTFNGRNDGVIFMDDGNSFQIHYGTLVGHADFITITAAIPEPATWMVVLLLSGVAFFFSRPRRRLTVEAQPVDAPRI